MQQPVPDASCVAGRKGQGMINRQKIQILPERDGAIYAWNMQSLRNAVCVRETAEQNAVRDKKADVIRQPDFWWRGQRSIYGRNRVFPEVRDPVQSFFPVVHSAVSTVRTGKSLTARRGN